MKNKFNYILFPVLSFTIILILWSFVSYSGLIKEFFLPTPTKVVQAIIELFVSHNFIKDVGISLFRILTGFFIATILGIPLGILIALNSKVESFVEPPVDFIRYTPIPAFVPLFILWFGIGEVEKIIIISASVFFQLILMVANSVSVVPKEMIESAQTLGANRRQLITKVISQHAKPRILDDLRVSMGWAWAGLMIAEIVGSTSGLGFVIIQAQRLLQTANVIATLVIIGLFGLFFDYSFKKLSAIYFPWVEKIKHNATA